MNNDFDPYDALISMNERLHRLEQAHNRLAKDYERTQKEFTEALISQQKTQQHLLNLQKLVHQFIVNPDKPR